MKVRTDFVTNSSSSSFIIAKQHLDEDQIAAIKDHYDMMVKMGMIDPNDTWMYPWNIEENADFIAGDVSMDNLPIVSLLEKIDIPEEIVTWGEYPFELKDHLAKKAKNTTDDDWRKYLHED